MAVELRVVAPDGVPDAVLPDWSDLTFSQDFNPGVLTFTYALKGRGASLLDHAVEIAALLDGIEPADARFMINQAQGTNLAEQDASATRTYSSPSIRQLLDKLLIGPSLASTVADQSAPGSPGVWTNVTPGDLVIKAIQYGIVRAQQALGLSSGVNPLKWLTWPITSFSATQDSKGTAWPVTVDYTAGTGDSVGDVLSFLSDNGFAQSRMQGHSLQLYTPANFGTNLSTGTNPVVIASGKDFTDASYQTDSSDLVNAVLVIGDNTTGGSWPAVKWVYDVPSIQQFGYREGTITARGLNTQAMLTQVGNAYLSYMKATRWSYTYTQAASYLEAATNPYDFRPFIDFGVGDTILIMDGSQFLADRVRLLSADWPSAQKATVNLTINDFFAEREVTMNQRLKQLGG